MMILELWAKNIHRMNSSSIRRECGVRAYGIEYRIMLEGGVVELPPNVVQDDLISDVDLVWNRVHGRYPEEMDAVREYYKRGSYRAVRLSLGCGQYRSVQLVKTGELLIRGALLMIW